jgi:ParB family chromosome partitioning protein
MGRRVRLDSLADDQAEDVPGLHAGTLVRAKVSSIAPTPLNPRSNYGDDAELAELGESLRVRQLQPVAAVTRDAYLKLWPEHEEQIGSAAYVLANGERRYRAACHVTLNTLEVVVREDITDSQEAFLDAVVSENLDRKDFDPIEEAQAVEAMVATCGTAAAAAERFRRTEAWISQRRALLKLIPELQADVRSGKLPVRVARSVATAPASEQMDALAAKLAENNRATAAVPNPRSSGSSKQASTATKRGDSSKTSDGRAGKSGDAGAIPWNSPEALALLLRQRVEPANLRRLVKLLNDPEFA